MDIFAGFATQVLELFSHEEVLSLNLYWLRNRGFLGHDLLLGEVNVKPHLVSVFAYSAALLMYVTVGERQQCFVICKTKIKKRFHVISPEMIFCGVAHPLINSNAADQATSALFTQVLKFYEVYIVNVQLPLPLCALLNDIP